MRLTLKSVAEDLEKVKKQLKDFSTHFPQPEKPSKYIDNGDGTVTDKETNLTWMKQDDGKRRKWKEAQEYAEKNEAKLPGEGWRLPTVKELISIIDYDRHSPAIDPIFTNTQSSYYWSSTPYANDSNGAWDVYFSYGSVNWYYLDDDYYVRPVRQDS